MSKPIRLAMIGSGIFAREAHVPALQALGDAFQVVAVCSQTEKSASVLRAMLPGDVDIYTDSTALLARADIEAVDIVLPISIMPEIVENAIRAGKHVISEKPVAPTVARGQQLLALPRQGVWMVAENWRYERAIQQAAEIVRRGDIGSPMFVTLMAQNPTFPQNRYYNTAWRRDNSFPGGFLFDAGVHHIATLRMILGEITSTQAVGKQIRPDLPPMDTLCASLDFENGAVGSYNATYAAADWWPMSLHIAGSKGTIRVQTDQIEITIGDTRTKTEVKDAASIRDEFADFASAIQQGTTPISTPEQALRDVAVFEAMLQSAEKHIAVAVQSIRV